MSNCCLSFATVDSVDKNCQLLSIMIMLASYN